LDLPAAAGAHETPKLLFIRPSSVRSLVLEGAERSKLTLSGDDLFHGGSTDGADQLVLQVRDAHEETQRFHAGATEVRAEAGALETAPEVTFFCGVTQARQSDIQTRRTEQIQKASDVHRAAHWHDGNALSVKISTTALGERFQRELIADPFNKHDRTHVNADGGQLESLLVVHAPSLAAHPAVLRRFRPIRKSLARRGAGVKSGEMTMTMVIRGRHRRPLGMAPAR
jgi:hypothetical protein